MTRPPTTSESQPAARVAAGAAIDRQPLALVLFRLGDLVCALPMASVREIVHMACVSRAPGLPSQLEGFLNLGGTAIPVLRTARLLGLAGAGPGLYSSLLILHGARHPLALLVDEVTGTWQVAGDSLLPVAAQHALNDCVAGMLEAPDGAVQLLSVDRILFQEERRRLAELQAMAQQRLRDFAHHDQ